MRHYFDHSSIAPWFDFALSERWYLGVSAPDGGERSNYFFSALTEAETTEAVIPTFVSVSSGSYRAEGSSAPIISSSHILTTEFKSVAAILLDQAYLQPLATTNYSVSANPNPVNENAGTVTFTITRSGSLAAETLYASTVNGGANGYAVNNGDYATNVNNLAVSFAANQTSKTVTLSITNDSITESDETFGFIVQRSSGDPVSTFLAKTNWTIHDDDAVVAPTYSVSANPNPVNENAGTVSFTITRSGSFPAETIFASTVNGSSNGYAVNNGDYATNVNNLAVSFAANQTSQTVTLSITNDSTTESDETFGFVVQRNSGDPVSTFLAKTNWTIHDDDAVVAPTYSVSANPNPVNENAGTVTFTITRSGSFPAETLYASTVNGSANGYAVNNGDYATNINNFGVNFASGQSSATVTLAVTNDSTSESDETFGFVVQRNSGDPVSTFLAKTNWTIHDDDAVVAPTYSVSANPNPVNENAGTVTFTITRSGSFPAETLYASTVNGSANGYAVNNGDYGANVNNLGVNFASGQSSATVTLAVTNDSVAESDETFGFVVQRNFGDPVSTFLAKTSWTIHDDDTTQNTNDDYRDDPNDTSVPFGAVSVGGSTTGFIGSPDSDDTYGDKDVFKVHLQQGQAYEIRLTSTQINGQLLPLGIFTVRDPSQFDSVLKTSTIGSNVVTDITADATGDYYIRVGTGGAATDQGGYRLSVTNVTPVNPTDDYPDYPGYVGALHAITTIPSGSSLSGVIEAVGDKDVFAISVIAGHTYQLSLAGGVVAGTDHALRDVYMTLRDGSNFSTQLSANGGPGQAAITFTAVQTSTEYVRIGSGGGGTYTGGYGLSVLDRGIPRSQPTPPATTTSPVDDALAYGKFVLIQLLTDTGRALADDKTWDAFAVIMARMNDTQAVEFAQEIQGGLGNIVPAINIFEGVATQVLEAPPGQKARTAYTAFMDASADAAITSLGSEAGAIGGGTLSAVIGSVVPVAGTFAGGLLGAMLGGIVGGGGAHLIYEHFLHDWVVTNAGKLFDASFGATSIHSGSGLDSSDAAAPYISSPDESALVRFDSDWYLSTYADAVAAISSGTAGSAYAYFLTVGIDKGEQPNASQYLARADLPFTILNNDPLALGNAALVTQPLGTYAGDGLSGAESDVATAIKALHAGSALAADSTLSAIANRKATDLVANFSSSAVRTALSHSDSAWAADWSNGNSLTQQFREALERALGAGVPDANYKMFIVASASSSASDVIHQLQSQSDFAAALGNANLDTLGIAEYAGIWVVIIANAISTYNVTTPGSDGLASVTQYGGLNDDILYVGTRPAHLYGLGGNDALHGGQAGDALTGGPGDDSYFIGNSAETIVEGADEGGNDRIYTSVNYTLGAGVHVELLSTDSDAGTTALTLVGNEFDNTLRGNAGDNILYGMGGNDQMVGLGGNDSYIVDSALDRVVEAVGGGHDTIFASVSYALAADAEVEVLATTDYHGSAAIDLTGNDFAQQIFGNATGNTLIAGAGDDYLDGQGGADNLYGGTGDDVFIVDRANDLVFENAGEGTDSVESTAGYYLYANIENLFLLPGAGDIFGVGNDLANQIVGNEGSNLLIAGAGDDLAWGGGGNDSLFGQDGADHLYGEAGIDYLVGGAGDDILDGGADADALYGEEGNDTLVGGTDFKTDILVGGNGDDILFGNSGLGDYDLMDGGAGNDRYLVDTPADLTFEAANGGTDTVFADIQGAGYYLYANVENLVLLGTTPYGVGNELDNYLAGNASANWLLGGAGNDVLNGKAGNDVLFGEAGADTFVFEHGTGGDTIGDFAPGTDKIDLSAFGFANYQAVVNSMHEVNGTTAVDLGGGDFIVLNGVAAATLHASDFILSVGNQAIQLEARISDADAPVTGSWRGVLEHHYDPPSAYLIVDDTRDPLADRL